METTTPLMAELEVFEKHREDWSKAHLGKYVVVQGDTVIDKFFDEYADAFKTGIEKFGIGRSFLVKQIWKTEPVYFIA
jgi:Mg2+ and Co2+ transporter CorA